MPWTLHQNDILSDSTKLEVFQAIMSTGGDNSNKACFG